MNGCWFKLCSVLKYGISVSVVSLKNSILLPLVLARCAQELFSEGSQRDSIHSTVFIRILHIALVYLYKIDNDISKFHFFSPLSLSAMKTPEKIQRCTLLSLVKGMCSGSSHNLKDGSRLTFHYFWNNYDRI